MMVRDDRGRGVATSIVNPMPVPDDWAVLADGTIAVVRGREYRVDFISNDGKFKGQPRNCFSSGSDSRMKARSR